MRWFSTWFRIHSPRSVTFLIISMILTCVLTIPMSSDLFSDDQLTQGTSNFECSFASGFDVDANSAMGKLRADQIVLDSWQQASSRIAQTECTHLLELLVHRANHWASMDVCDKKHGGCAIMNYFHSAASIAHKEAQQDGRKEERDYHDQPESRTDCRGCLYQGERRRCLSECDRELHVFNTASGPISRCRGGSLAGTLCTLIKAWHDGAVVPGGMRRTNRTGGSSASGSGGPGTLPRRDDGTQDPPPITDWTAQVQALAANPHRNSSLSGNFLHQQYQQVHPEDGGSTGDPVEHGHGSGSEVCYRPIQQ